ncbi:MAG: hypothetical protein IKG98_11675 [Ruminococcus sp.]|nr:hypothetical protein [Ruminococcus sp.]
MWANVTEAVPTEYIFPDVNGDGKVNAIDASMILAAYSAISTGQDPGLTEEQLDACDANRDGHIDARDATLVLTFYSLVSVGRYDGSPESWTEFMNDRKNGVI